MWNVPSDNRAMIIKDIGNKTFKDIDFLKVPAGGFTPYINFTF